MKSTNKKLRNKSGKKLRNKSGKKTNNKSNSAKYTWEQFLNKKESIDFLKQSWKTPNPKESYSSRIKILHKKYSCKER